MLFYIILIGLLSQVFAVIGLGNMLHKKKLKTKTNKLILRALKQQIGSVTS
jgi:hypothetical protein